MHQPLLWWKIHNWSSECFFETLKHLSVLKSLPQSFPCICCSKSFQFFQALPLKLLVLLLVYCYMPWIEGKYLLQCWILLAECGCGLKVLWVVGRTWNVRICDLCSMAYKDAVKYEATIWVVCVIIQFICYKWWFSY